MTGNFAINTLDMVAAAGNNPALAVTEGTAYAAPYLYVTPHNGYVIAKIDARTFTLAGTLDLSQVDPGLTGMAGSFAAGGYLYVLPHLSSTGPVYQDKVVQVDLANFTPAGCTTLAVLNASSTLSALGGLTDGTNGYLDITVSDELQVTRFGLGANFNAASVSTVSIDTIEGYPVLLGQLVAVDQSYVYIVATVVTAPPTGGNPRTMDLWLVTIPTAKFIAKRATFQRLTNFSYPGASVPKVQTAFDDGTNIWLPPIPILVGPLANTFTGVMQIPKANPAAVTINQGPGTQPFPTPAGAGTTSIYDGNRYGYVASQSEPQIMQIDTLNPGTVNLIDITTPTADEAMFGLGYDGKWIYAVSLIGGAGLCLRVREMPPPA